MAWFIAAFLLLFSVAGIWAHPIEPTKEDPLANPLKESAARALMSEIRCMACQSQSIDESAAEIGAQLRNMEIHDYLTARYGDFVLLDPRFDRSTIILWLGRCVLAGLAVAGTFGILRRRHAPGGGAKEATSIVVLAELTEAARRHLQELLFERGKKNCGETAP